MSLKKKRHISTSGPLKFSEALKYQHYLDIIVPAHCKVLTWLLTSCHSLAVNSIRWDPVWQRSVP